MLLYIKRTTKRLPWHISVGTLPLPTTQKGTNFKYAANTFCGHKIFGLYYPDHENPYYSHHVSDTLPSHRLELCQNCIKSYEHKTGQPFNFL